MSEIVPAQPSAMDLAAESTVFQEYLAAYGLPIDNVIASTDQRAIVASNLPSFLGSLSPEEKGSARYLSKFIGASAIGLFDAALNYIWNEVVLSLRQKACIYGIELFFDAAVGGKNREYYKDEDDLDGLKDSVLLDTCRKLELISDIVYRKLDHILTMRNEVAASHPNVESIGGFELLGWLQTCVSDVLQDRPSESAIRIKALVDNIKARTDVVDSNTAGRFGEELPNLSPTHVQNLLVAMFGMFCSAESDQILRANIAKLAPLVWDCADEDVKYRVGTIIDGYRTNLQQDKLDRGVEFLELVDGKKYESLPAKIIALEGLAEELNEAHDGWDNFYNEPPLMREILGYMDDSTDIPREVLPRLARVVVRCRLGRGLTYREGVSPGGRVLYDQFLGMLDDTGILECIKAIYRPDINSKLGNPICRQHLGSILTILRAIAISERLKEMLDYLLADLDKAGKANLYKDFKELSAPLVKW